MRLFSKRVVLNGIEIRVAILCCLLGVITVQYWKSDETITRFEVISVKPPPPLSTSSHAEHSNKRCFLEEKHTKTHLSDVTLKRSKFSASDLSGAHISNSDFENASFVRASFSDARVSTSNFMSANFRGADLSRSKFHGCDFTGANLAGTRLVRAYLVHASFENANLRNADFTDANLGDAQLENTTGLTYSQLEKAVINEFTTLPVHLVSKRLDLFRKSKERAKRIKRELSSAEYDVWKHEFFDIAEGN